MCIRDRNKKVQEEKIIDGIEQRKQVSLTEERLIKLERSLESMQKGFANTPTSKEGTIDAQSIAKMNASNYAQFQDMKDQIKEVRGEIEQMQFDIARPVSYTHLDVYKRQKLNFKITKN